MPPKTKAKTAPNQHDKRHENGLAPPGKRVAKKHSNGHLNGLPNGKPVTVLPPSPNPAASLTARPKPSLVHLADSHPPAEPPQDHATAPEALGRDRVYSEASLDDAGPWGDMGEPYQEPGTAAAAGTLPVEPPTASYRRSGCPPGGTLYSVSTLLAYYPLRDAISILILLLSLPPTLVLLIQTLFASLTFVPPTASISLSTLPNIKEIFNSSNFGYPALATILIVDLIFWVCWLPVWKPVQNVFLDFSQAVIAISLSGAAASSRGPTYSIVTCTAIVCAVHVLRYKAIHLTALDYLRSVINKASGDVVVGFPSFLTNSVLPVPEERGWLHTVIRTILGIHIVSQGVTTCIRRSLVRANEQSASAPAITRHDSESITGSDPAMRSNSAVSDTGPHGPSSQSADGRPQGPSSTHRDSRASRESISKKRRKQANQVRSQQPLWAAIASTKVTFVKEMEQRDALHDVRESARMDNSTPAIVSGSNYLSNNCIWLSDVRDNGFSFTVELLADRAIAITGGADGDSGSSGTEQIKSFYVRINGAAWSSLRIMASANEENVPWHGHRYDGEIYGLAPLSSYSCEIVASTSHEVLCSANVITAAAPRDEQAVFATVQLPHPALRPSSPVTTLKQSIQQAEAKLNETRNRTKKNKKDQRAVHSDIKREINLLRSKLETSGGADDRQERRLMQINQHKNQAEEAAAELKQQVEALGEVPVAELAASDEKRKKWQTASDAKSAASKEFDKAKADADRELHLLRSEVSQTESKHEKLTSRLAQRKQELESLSSKQQADMSAKQTRDLERAQAAQRRGEEESELKYHINSFNAELQKLQQKSQDAYQEIAALHSWPTTAVQQQQPPPGYHNSYSSPPTPDNTLPGPGAGTANGSLGSPQSNGFPSSSKFAFQSHHSSQASNTLPAAPRGRSSSMLSQYSGFTDSVEDPPGTGGSAFGAPDPLPPHFQHQQHHTQSQSQAQIQPQQFFAGWPADSATAASMSMAPSAGPAPERSASVSLTSGSGSTGSNSPRPDARVFTPASATAVAVKPIAPPGKSKDSAARQSPLQAASGLGGTFGVGGGAGGGSR